MKKEAVASFAFCYSPFIIHTIFIPHSEFSISHFVYSPSCLLRLEKAFVSPSSTKPLSVSPI